MKPNERKAAMMLAGVTGAAIARDLGCRGSHVSMVLNGGRRSARVEGAIAKAIGRPVEEVFPPRVESEVVAA